MAPKPPAARHAPTRLATREWLTLTGKPRRVADSTQITDAKMAAMTVYSLISSGLTIPLPMVLATAVPVSAPIRLKVAPMATAASGVMTRVETTVAMAFAASLMPLVYANAKARTIVTTKMTPAASGILENYAF